MRVRDRSGHGAEAVQYSWGEWRAELDDDAVQIITDERFKAEYEPEPKPQWYVTKRMPEVGAQPVGNLFGTDIYLDPDMDSASKNDYYCFAHNLGEMAERAMRPSDPIDLLNRARRKWLEGDKRKVVVGEWEVVDDGAGVTFRTPRQPSCYLPKAALRAWLILKYMD